MSILTSNYTVITDQEELDKFIDFLPEISGSETYYISLFARRKYCKEIAYIKTDSKQLRRFTTTKENMFNKIRQCECPLGSYVGRTNASIPQEALALYITINPRSMELAAKHLLVSLADLITKPYNNYNPHQEALSAIQKTASKKYYIDFDFDCAGFTNDIRDTLLTIVNREAVYVLQTRGGFHLLVKPSAVKQELKNSWYLGILNTFSEYIDVRGDNLLPVPGTYQGGFTPRLIKL